MNKVLTVFLVLASMCFFATNSFATGCTNRGCTAPVRAIYPSTSDSGRVFVELKNVDMASANCTPVEGMFYSLYKDHPMFEENMKLIQTAAITGKEIFLRIHEGSNVCEISYVKVIY